MRVNRWRLGAAVYAALLVGVVFAIAFAGATRTAAPVASGVSSASRDASSSIPTNGPTTRLGAPKSVTSKPTQLFLTRAHSAVFNVRNLKSIVIKQERPEHEDPFGPPGRGRAEWGDAYPGDPYPGAADSDPAANMPAQLTGKEMVTSTSAQTPSSDSSFDGLDFANWGAGHPPDENGDVGPTYYIQTVNTSIGIYDKSNGNRVAAFTFNSFMSQGHFGNLCDTNNFGDPVVLYDSFEDRWVITDFAFALDAGGNVSPQTVFECFAVSKTGDPVNGGWNYYSIITPGGLGDYPKFGVWTDGIYMSANMFGYAAAGTYQGYHVWALNKQQMYAGAPTVQVVDFTGNTGDFALLPANARLQSGTPPAGTPEYFVSTEQFLNALSIYKFQVNWDKISTSTFTTTAGELMSNCWPNSTPPNASTPANAADTLSIRAMAQAQYTNQGGAESVWVAHTVRRLTSANNVTCNAATTGNATVRWYQANVTGGTVGGNLTQTSTFDPEAANTFFRFQPSLAVDHSGNMAMTYTKSNAATFPSIMFNGRLAGDPANTLGTESTLIAGTGAQSGNCGGAACVRWGDYAGMALDPDGCHFWMTGEYFAVSGLNDLTRIGSFHYPSCTPVGNGTLSGTVTDGSNPISGATMTLGSRTTTTDASGNYSFTLPAGTYSSLLADKGGYTEGSASSLAVPDGGTLTRNFTLSTAATSGCITDNTQSLFQRGVASANCDITSSPGSVLLSPGVDQQNTAGTTTGTGTTTNVSWAGQTFTAAKTGNLTKVDFTMFCTSAAACTSNPNLIVSIRATSAGSPTGADLVSATIPGDNSGNTNVFVASFASPLAITAGTQYALIVRTAASTGGTSGYFWIRSSPSTYAGGLRVTSANSGSTWAQDSTRDGNFHTYVGFASSATLVSSMRDANPAAGYATHWTTLTFSATTPANTAVKFQVAGSNSQYGPWNYVGPDGTASTFFTTSGASLGQFNGYRYLRYTAFLSSDGSATPTLSSVSTCFQNLASTTTLAAASASGVYGGTTTLSATLTTVDGGVAGKTVNFTLNGSSAGGATTDVNGVATLNNVSLAGINADSYPSGVGASFAGDLGYGASNGTNSLTISRADQAITITQHAPATATVEDTFSVSATGGGSGNAVTYGSSGGCTNTGPNYTVTGAGACTVSYNQAGNTNYNAAPQLTDAVNSAKHNQTIHVVIHAPASAVYGTGFTVSATGGNSGNPVTYGSSGGCTNTGADFTMTSGTTDCTVTYNQLGNSNYDPATQVTETVTAQKADQTIDVTTPAPSSALYAAWFEVEANAPSGAIAFASTGQCTNAGHRFTMTSGTGTCVVHYNRGGDDNYNAAPEVTESVTAQKADQSITFPAIAGHTYGDLDFDPGATSSAGFAVTYDASGKCVIIGGQVHVTGAGSCTVTAHAVGDANYNDAPDVQRSFSIAKAALSITANNRSKYYAQALVLGTTAFSSSGLVGSDSIAGVTLTSSGTGAFAAAGNYAIVASAATNGPSTDLAGNYTVSYHDGTLHVVSVGLIGLNGVSITTSATVKINSFDSGLGAYGAANHGSNAFVASNGPISFARVTVNGSAASTSNGITIASTASVSGNVTAGTTVSHAGTVGGTITQNSPSTALSAPTVSPCSQFTSGLKSSARFTYSPSTGNLAVLAGTLKLPNGTYCFNNVSITLGATLQVDGPVTIRLSGKLGGSGGYITNAHPAPGDLKVFSTYSGAHGILVYGNGHAYMQIVAPGTDAEINNGGFFGTLLAATVNLTHGTKFHADTH